MQAISGVKATIADCAHNKGVDRRLERLSTPIVGKVDHDDDDQTNVGPEVELGTDRTVVLSPSLCSVSVSLSLSTLSLFLSYSLSPNCVVLFAFIFLFPAKIFLLNLKILLDKHVGELSDLPFDGHVDETRTVLTVLHDETTQQRLINFRL